jgi:hypothetical protein
MILSRLEHLSNPIPRKEDQKPYAASPEELEYPVLLQVLFSYLFVPVFLTKMEFTLPYSLLSSYPESTPITSSENCVNNLNIKFVIRLKL